MVYRVQQSTPVMAIIVDGRQLPQLRLVINSGQGPSVRARVYVSDNRDSSTLIFQFGIPRTSHSNHDILHTMVAIDHIDNNFFNTALGDEVACALSGPP